MYTASSLVLPRGAYPTRRPGRAPRGTLHLPPSALGVFSRPDLLDLGYSDWQLRSAVASGNLRRLAPGWYAHPDADPRIIRPLTAACRLSCIDALAAHGLWVPHRYGDDVRRLHVYRRGRAPSCPPWAIEHSPFPRTWPERDPVASLGLALQHAMHCLDGESAAIVLESSMERGLLDPADVQVLLDQLPTRARSRIGSLSVASDSGSETRVARWLRRRGFTVEQQVYVEGAGYVDAYVAGVFLQIDGRAHHSSPEAFADDRRRDLAMRRHGLQLLRLSYDQTWRSWQATQQALLETIDAVGPLGRRRVAQLVCR